MLFSVWFVLLSNHKNHLAFSYEYDVFSGSSSYNATRTSQGTGEQMMNTGQSIRPVLVALHEGFEEDPSSLLMAVVLM